MRNNWMVLVALSLALVSRCGGNRPKPPAQLPPSASPTATSTPTPSSPAPSPTPTSTPSPDPLPAPSPSPTPTTPTLRPTPFPTPVIDPASYLPKFPSSGRMAIVSGPDLSAKIQAAQDDPNVDTVHVEGGGPITSQVIVRKHTSFDSSTYSIEILNITDFGAFLIADNASVTGTWRPPSALIDYFNYGRGYDPTDKYLLAVQALTPEQLAGTGTTILEPTFVADWAPLPHITVFQALGDACCAHTDKADHVSVVGFHIKGRQRTYDGGVRSTILFGNCHHCTAQYNYLEDTASIGITFGGSALEFTRPDGVHLANNFANDVLAYRNITSGVAAANIAAINAENFLIVENYALRPGHHDPIFGGGVCGFDLETNSTADHTGGMVLNNLYDYEGGATTGSAICLQDPYFGVNHRPVTAANNIIIGGRDDIIHRYLTNGLFLNGLTNCHISNNYVYRTGQNAIQAYGLTRCIIEDQDFESTGGGGNPTVVLNGVVESIIRRNNFRSRPGLAINTQSGFVDSCGRGNVFTGNLILGQPTTPISKCP